MKKLESVSAQCKTTKKWICVMKNMCGTNVTSLWYNICGVNNVFHRHCVVNSKWKVPIDWIHFDERRKVNCLPLKALCQVSKNSFVEKTNSFEQVIKNGSTNVTACTEMNGTNGLVCISFVMNNINMILGWGIWPLAVGIRILVYSFRRGK